MTFEKFQQIVKENKPELIVYQHDYCGAKNCSVSVKYNENGKVYTYSGSYIQVLNKLGIKVAYKTDVDQLKKTLNHYIEMNNGGYTSLWFSKPIIKGAYQQEVNMYQNMLREYEGHIIIE